MDGYKKVTPIIFKWLLACVIFNADAAIIQEVSNISTCLGENVTLNWRYSSTENLASCFWYKNQTVIMAKYGSSPAQPQLDGVQHIENGVIKLINVSKTDAGEYKLIVSYIPDSGIPTATGSTSVTVKVPPSSIQHNVSTEVSGKRTYTCFVMKLGEPPVAVGVKVGSVLESSQSATVDLTQEVKCCIEGKSVTCLQAYNGPEEQYCIDIFTPYGPVNITLEPSTAVYTLNVSETLHSITCHADCNPACSFQWFKDEKEMVSNNSILLSRTIVGKSDSGKYECRANRLPTNYQKKEITVHVRYGPDKVSFVPADVKYLKNENDFLNDIRCEADCYPNCTFIWYTDSVLISGHNNLSLGRLNRSKAAIYTCKATNAETKKVSEQSLEVVVYYGPDTVMFDPADVQYIKNESDILNNIRCEADCKPDCTYRWYADSAVISNYSILSLGSLNRSEATTYTCRATNAKTKKVLEGILNIVVYYGPASVTIGPHCKNCTENEGYMLPDRTCVADCYPQCSYHWRKGDVVLSENSTLSLGRLNKSEAGTYTCTAIYSINTEKSASQSFTLHIRYGPDRITFNLTDTNQEISEGSYLPTVSCLADCYPGCSQSWKYMSGSKDLKNGSYLSLGIVMRYDAGEYMCTSKNSAAEFRKNLTRLVNLTVKYFPKVEVKTIGEVEFTEKSLQFTLECTAKGIPDKYQYFNWVHYAPGTLIKIQEYAGQEEGKKLQLTKNNLSYMDSGVYMCIVTNGERDYLSNNTNATSNVNITVKGQPQIFKANTVVYGAIDSDVKLSVLFYSNDGHVPSVKWYTFANDTFTYNSIGADDKYYNSVVTEDVQVKYYDVSITQEGYRAQLEIRNVNENDFKIYEVSIGNTIKNVNYTVELRPRGPPSSPINFTVIAGSETTNSISLIWFPGFHGGLDQSFYIEYRSNTSQWTEALPVLGSITITRHFNTTITGLMSGTFYTFRIYSVNELGRSNESVITFGKTLMQSVVNLSHADFTAAAVGGGIGGAFVIIGAILGVVFVKRRTLKQLDKDGVKKLSARNNRDHQKAADDLEITTNPVYDSSGELSNAPNKDVYSQVLKHKPQPIVTGTDDSTALYSEVRKQNKQPNKSSGSKNQKKQKNIKNPKLKTALAGTEYENSETWRKTGQDINNIYENPSCSTNDEDARQLKFTRTKNADGLIYVELDLPISTQVSDRMPIIHGLEDRNDYADIEFGKVGEKKTEIEESDRDKDN